MNAAQEDCTPSAAPDVLAPEGDGAVVTRADADRLTIEVTVHKAVHPALFAALSEVDRRHRAERVRLLGTRGLLAEQQPDAAVAASISRTSPPSGGAAAALGAHGPVGGDGGRRITSSVVVDDAVGSVFR